MKKKSLFHVVKFSVLSTLLCVASSSYAIQCFDKVNVFIKPSSAKLLAGTRGKVLREFNKELKEVAVKLGRDVRDSDILQAHDLDSSTSFYVVINENDLFFLTNFPEKLGVKEKWGFITNQTIGFHSTGFSPKRVQLGDDKIAINQGNRWKIFRKENVEAATLSTWLGSSDVLVTEFHKIWAEELSSLIGRPLKSDSYISDVFTVNDIKNAQFIKSESGETTFAVIKGKLVFLRKNPIKDDLTNGAKIGLVPTSGPGFGIVNKNVIKLEKGIALVIGNDGFKIVPQYEIASLLDMKAIDLDSFADINHSVLDFVKENQDILPKKMQEFGLSFSEVLSSQVMKNLNSEDAGHIWLNNAGAFLVKDGNFQKIEMDPMGVYKGENLQVRIGEDKVLIFEKGQRVTSKAFKVHDGDYALSVEMSDPEALKAFVEFHGIRSDEFKKSVYLYNGRTFDIDGEATLAEYKGTLYILDEGEFKKYSPNVGIGFHTNVEREFNVGDNMIISFSKKGMVKYPLLKEGNADFLANLYLSTQNSLLNKGFVNLMGINVVSHLLKSKMISTKDLFSSSLHLAFTKSGASYFVLKAGDESLVMAIDSAQNKVMVQKASEINEELLLANYTRISAGQKIGFISGNKVKEDILMANEVYGVLALKTNLVLGREISDEQFTVLQEAFHIHHMVYSGIVFKSEKTEGTLTKLVLLLRKNNLFSDEDIKAMVSSDLL